MFGGNHPFGVDLDGARKLDPTGSVVCLAGNESGKGLDHRDKYRAIVDEFVCEYRKNGWKCPVLEYSDYYRCAPGDERLPLGTTQVDMGIYWSLR